MRKKSKSFNLTSSRSILSYAGKKKKNGSKKLKAEEEEVVVVVKEVERENQTFIEKKYLHYTRKELDEEILNVYEEDYEKDENQGNENRNYRERRLDHSNKREEEEKSTDMILDDEEIDEELADLNEEEKEVIVEEDNEEEPEESENEIYDEGYDEEEQQDHEEKNKDLTGDFSIHNHSNLKAPKLDTYQDISDSDSNDSEAEDEMEEYGSMDEEMELDLSTVIDTAFQSNSAARRAKNPPLRTEAFPENEFSVPSHAQTKLNVRQLVSALNDEVEFGGLKQQVVHLKREDRETKTLLEPLPDRVQARVQRQTFYKETKRQVGQWYPIVEHIKNSEHVTFPLPYASNTPLPSTRSLTQLTATQSSVASELDKGLAKLTKSAGATSSTPHTFEDTELPLDFDQVQKEDAKKSLQELRQLRSLAIYQQIKARRAAKIKSKSYRRILKREKHFEKTKKLQSVLESSALEQHALKLQAEYERAENRLTLKKKSTWAQCAALIPDKDGENAAPATSMNVSEMAAEEDEVEAAEDAPLPKKGLFAMKFMLRGTEDEKAEMDTDLADSGAKVATAVAGRRIIGLPRAAVVDPTIKNPTPSASSFRFNTSSSSAPCSVQTSHESDDESNPWMTAQTNRDKISSSSSANPPLLSSQVVQLEHPGSEHSVSFQKEMVAEIFSNDHVIDEFVAAKEAAVQEDAPKDIDVTLPGWGSWAGYAAPELPPQKRKYVRVPGTSPADRADHGLHHVILHTKLPKHLCQYMAPTLPHPFVDPAHYESAMRPTLGREWVTAQALQQAVAPKFQVPAGYVLAPPCLVPEQARRIQKSHLLEKEGKASATTAVKGGAKRRGPQQKKPASHETPASKKRKHKSREGAISSYMKGIHAKRRK